MPKDPDSLAAAAHLALMLDFTRASERIISTKKDLGRLIEDVGSLLELDNASMVPEVAAVLPHLQEIDELLGRAFLFMTARLDTHRDQVFSPMSEGGEDGD